MAQNDTWKRYLDAGMAFTQMTRDRAEALVKAFVENGEVQREQASEWVEDLVERSRKNTEAIVELVRTEIRSQLKAMGVTGPGRGAGGSRPGTKSAAPKSAAPKPAATTVKKTAKKTAATAKRATSSGTTKAGAAKKTAVKKAGAAKKSAAKKATKSAKKA